MEKQIGYFLRRWSKYIANQNNLDNILYISIVAKIIWVILCYLKSQKHKRLATIQT